MQKKKKVYYKGLSMQFRFPSLVFKRKIEKLARESGRSLNNYIVSVLSQVILDSDDKKLDRNIHPPQEGEK